MVGSDAHVDGAPRGVVADVLLRARDIEVDGALWVALRSLQEKGKLARRLAEHVEAGPLHTKYTQQAEEAEHALTILSERLAVAPPVNGGHGDS
jgi:two-component system chemotaxis response regulator CheB